MRHLILGLVLGINARALAGVPAAAPAPSAVGAAPAAEKKNGSGKIVTIEVHGAAISDVLRLLFDQAGEKGLFSESETTGRKLTAMLKEIPFETALMLVANAAGMRVEKKDSAWVLTLSAAAGWPAALPIPVAPGRTAMPQPNAVPIFLHCNSCTRTATLLHSLPVKSAACDKCGRAQSSEWEFCPSCGSKRTKEADELSYCPFCGKALVAPARKEPAQSAADVAGLRMQLGQAEAAIAAARARLANSQGRLLRQQNEAALRQAEANATALREKLKPVETSTKKQSSSLVTVSLVG